MSFVTQTCSPGERVLYRTSYHWLYWLGGAALTAGPLLTLAARPFGDLASILVLGATLIGTPFGLFILVRAFATEIAVTSDRFVKKSGLVSIQTEDINLDKLEEIELKHDVLGALFGYGTLEAHGSGAGSIKVKMVQSPDRLRLEIENAREGLHVASAPPRIPKAA